MLGPVPAEISHIRIYVCERYRCDERQIHILNRNFIKLRTARNKTAFNFYVAKEIPQIQVILINRFSRMTLNGLTDISKNREELVEPRHDNP